MTDSLSFRPDYTAQLLAPGSYCTSCEIPANLFNAGSYIVDVLIGSEFELFIDLDMAASFKVVLKEWEIGKNWNENHEAIPFRPVCAWKTSAAG